jgi:hypothetical protein
MYAFLKARINLYSMASYRKTGGVYFLWPESMPISQRELAHEITF